MTFLGFHKKWKVITRRGFNGNFKISRLFRTFYTWQRCILQKRLTESLFRTVKRKAVIKVEKTTYTIYTLTLLTKKQKLTIFISTGHQLDNKLCLLKMPVDKFLKAYIVYFWSRKRNLKYNWVRCWTIVRRLWMNVRIDLR